MYTNCAPPPEILDFLCNRTDHQIMALELVSIALGLSTFEHECAGRKVIIHSDNKGAEGALRTGTAKSFDHCSLIHGMWTQALLSEMSIWVLRVPTDFNVADLPSRSVYCLLEAMGAKFYEPFFHEIYRSEETWRFLI